MKYASDFRRIARDSLRGRWTQAVLAGLIAALLGGISTSGPEVKFQFNDNGASLDLTLAGQPLFSTAGGISPQLQGFLIGSAMFLLLAALVLAVVFLVVGSVVKLGYSRFNLDLVDGQKAELAALFRYFDHWQTAVVTQLLQGLYIFLWSLLLIIPGIMAAYSYSMTGYILAEHPDLTASEALARSKQMMAGNRWRLFCLTFSFIGWSLLCLLTLGIGNLWLTPYEQTSIAAFYREISGTERRRANPYTAESM